MLRLAGIMVLGSLLQSGAPMAQGLEESFLLLTGGGRAPTPSELLIENIRMEQARRILREQVEQVEADLKCRRDPESCPPLIDLKSRPRPDLNPGEGVIKSDDVPTGSSSSPTR
jgi:hypothetical protein